MLSKTILSGLLLLSLTACGTHSAFRDLPDPALLADCPIPVPTGRDNAALGSWVGAMKGSLEACNADKATLREWANGS